MHILAKYKAKKYAHFRPIRTAKHLQSARSMRITSKDDDLAKDNHLRMWDLTGYKMGPLLCIRGPTSLTTRVVLTCVK